MNLMEPNQFFSRLLSGAAVSSATRPAFNKDRCFNLLVLDDQNTDWSKYFRGKRLHGDYDIRVEQAEFSELGLTANADAGTHVTLASFRSGSKVCWHRWHMPSCPGISYSECGSQLFFRCLDNFDQTLFSFDKLHATVPAIIDQRCLV